MPSDCYWKDWTGPGGTWEPPATAGVPTAIPQPVFPMPVTHPRCDCHACTQVRAAERNPFYRPVLS